MKKETRIGPQFTNSKQAASGKKHAFSYNDVEIYWEVSNSFFSDVCMYVWSWACSLVKKICQKEGAQIYLLCEMFWCYFETHISSLTIFSHTIMTNPLFYSYLCKLMALSTGLEVIPLNRWHAIVPYTHFQLKKSTGLTASRFVAETRRKKKSLLCSCC